MTCRDFQHDWHELLDAEACGAAVAEGEARLLSHAAECADCRPIAARYQVLRHALRAWRQPPVPPADLVQRILSTPADPQPRIWRSAAGRARRVWREHRPFAAVIAASITLVAIVLPAINGIFRRHQADPPMTANGETRNDRHANSGSERPPDDSLALNRALADATSATWYLARSASEPAARISRDVLDAATQAESRPGEAPMVASSTGMSEGLASLSVPIPSLDPLVTDATAGVLQQVGDHLSAGVRPLSTTARHAFGFLLGPPRDRAEPDAHGRTSRGA